MVFSTLENIFYPKNIHLCASVFSIFFIRLSTSARVDYNCISTFENIFNLKNVHLCASWLNGIFYTENIFYLRNIHLCGSVLQFFFIEDFLWASRLNMCFIHLKLFSTRRIYTFCAIWLKCLFLYLEMSSIQRIYTSVRVFQISYWRIFTSVRVD